MEKKRITVFDGDVGTDDAMALFLMARVTEEPDYVVATYGNAPRAMTFRNTLVVKGLLGMKCPVIKGAEKPFDGEEPTCGDYHGKDGLADIAEECAIRLGIGEKGEEAMDLEAFSSELQKADEITYIAVDPLTSLATLIRREEVKKRIKKVLIMGGGFERTNKDHDSEYNFAGDPKALKEILESGLNVTIFPLDLTLTHPVMKEEIDLLESFGRDPEFIRILRKNHRSGIDLEGGDGAILHDTLPILYKSFPEKFSVREKKILSDEWGHIEEATNGYSVFVAERAEEGFLFAMLKRGFGGEQGKS